MSTATDILSHPTDPVSSDAGTGVGSDDTSASTAFYRRPGYPSKQHPIYWDPDPGFYRDRPRYKVPPIYRYPNPWYKPPRYTPPRYTPPWYERPVEPPIWRDPGFPRYPGYPSYPSYPSYPGPIKIGGPYPYIPPKAQPIYRISSPGPGGGTTSQILNS